MFSFFKKKAPPAAPPAFADLRGAMAPSAPLELDRPPPAAAPKAPTPAAAPAPQTVAPAAVPPPVQAPVVAPVIAPVSAPPPATAPPEVFADLRGLMAPPPPPPPAREVWVSRLRDGLRQTGSSLANVFSAAQIDDEL
jgi:fused signal recognition particle receptor